jgi:hypothetical protein
LGGAVLALAGFAAGCADAPVANMDDAGFAFKGRVIEVQLEGGFFGIVTDEGNKLDPSNLPAALRVDGQRVQGRARELGNVMTIRMWGTPVDILEIRPAP